MGAKITLLQSRGISVSQTHLLGGVLNFQVNYKRQRKAKLTFQARRALPIYIRKLRTHHLQEKSAVKIQCIYRPVCLKDNFVLY